MTAPSKTEFRQATPEDLSALLELSQQVQELYEGYWPLRWGLRHGYLDWHARRYEESSMFLQLACDPSLGGDRLVVGMIHCTIEKDVPIYTYTHYAAVHDIIVRETHRHRGIARQFLASAAAWAKTQGVNQLRLGVANQNPTAHAAFQKAGFRNTYQEMILPL